MSSNKDIEQNRKEQHDHTELGREILRAAHKGLDQKLHKTGPINLTALRNLVYRERIEAKRKAYIDVQKEMNKVTPQIAGQLKWHVEDRIKELENQ